MDQTDSTYRERDKETRYVSSVTFNTSTSSTIDFDIPITNVDQNSNVKYEVSSPDIAVTLLQDGSLTRPVTTEEKGSRSLTNQGVDSSKFSNARLKFSNPNQQSIPEQKHSPAGNTAKVGGVSEARKKFTGASSFERDPVESKIVVGQTTTKVGGLSEVRRKFTGAKSDSFEKPLSSPTIVGHGAKVGGISEARKKFTGAQSGSLERESPAAKPSVKTWVTTGRSTVSNARKKFGGDSTFERSDASPRNGPKTPTLQSTDIHSIRKKFSVEGAPTEPPIEKVFPVSKQTPPTIQSLNKPQVQVESQSFTITHVVESPTPSHNVQEHRTNEAPDGWVEYSQPVVAKVFPYRQDNEQPNSSSSSVTIEVKGVGPAQPNMKDGIPNRATFEHPTIHVGSTDGTSHRASFEHPTMVPTPREQFAGATIQIGGENMAPSVTPIVVSSTQPARSTIQLTPLQTEKVFDHPAQVPTIGEQIRSGSFEEQTIIFRQPSVDKKEHTIHEDARRESIDSGNDRKSVENSPRIDKFLGNDAKPLPSVTPSDSKKPFDQRLTETSKTPASEVTNQGSAPVFVIRPRSTTAREGEKVEFIAKVTGSPTPEVTWSRDGKTLATSGNVQVSQSSDSHSLTISPTQSSDSTRYVCQATNTQGREKCSFNVTVTPARPQGRKADESMDFRSVLKSRSHNTPTPDSGKSTTAPSPGGKQHDFRGVLKKRVTKMEKPSFLVYLDDKEVRQGQSVTFEVKVMGSPPPKVTWYRGDEKIQVAAGCKMRSRPVGDHLVAELELANCQPRHAGSYSCRAENDAGFFQTSCALKVKENPTSRAELPRSPQPAEEVTKATTAHRLVRQEEITDTIRSGTPSPTPTLPTTRFGTPTIPPPAKTEPTPTPPRIETPTPPPQEAQDEPPGVPPPPPPTSSPPPIEKPERSPTPPTTSSTESSRSSTPPVMESKREPSQKPQITPEPEPQTPSEPTVPKTPPPQPDKAKSDESPMVVSLRPQSLNIEKGRKVELRGVFVGSAPMSVKWFLDESRTRTEIHTDDRVHIETSETTSSLTIREAQERDTGIYTLEVSNSLGQNQLSSSVTVEDKPDPPVAQPFISNIRNHSLDLSWYGSGYDGGTPILHYRVEMRQEAEDTWLTLTDTCQHTAFNIQNLEPNKGYEFRVSAGNRHGFGAPSKLSDLVYTMEHPVTETPEEDDGPSPNEKRMSYSQNAPPRLKFTESVDLYVPTPLLLSSPLSPDAFRAARDELPFEPRNVAVRTNDKFEDAYILGEQIGRGKFGCVYKCTDKSSNRTYAAKFIKTTRLAQKVDVKQELNVMNELHHPKLLLLWDAFETRREIVLVMEHVRGGELLARIVDDDYVLTERECVHFMRQICDGVRYMHKSNIVHLDLKPENVMCITSNSNEIKIIDFGLARQLDLTKDNKVMFGTAEFVAPEVVNYDAIGYGTDMWSVGVICYILLSGLSPFAGDSDSETFSNVTTAQYDFDCEEFDAISDDAKEFIEKLLERNCKSRMSAAECLQYKWLAQDVKYMRAKRLSTEKHKRFLNRMKWRKAKNAVEVINRMQKTLSRTSMFSTTKSQSSLESTPSLDSFSGSFSSDSTDTRPVAMETTITESISMATYDSGAIEDEKPKPMPVENGDAKIVSMETKESKSIVMENGGSKLVAKTTEEIKPVTVTATDSKPPTMPVKDSPSIDSLFSGYDDDKIYELPKRDRNWNGIKIRTSRLRSSTSQDISDTETTEPPLIFSKMKDYEVFAGDDAKFEIRLETPGSVNVSWYKDGSIIRENPKKYTVKHNDDRSSYAIVIRRCDDNDVAEYECRVTNAYGESTCKANLHVEGLDGVSHA